MRHIRQLAPWARSPFLLAIAALLGSQSAAAQVRERPVAFDSAGRITVITPPFAARLGLSAPLWPASGDYIDARLYALDELNSSFVLVVRRQREVLERYPLDATARRALGAAIDRGNTETRAGVAPDLLPTYISEPVRGSFVLNQTLLGAILFGPAAAIMVDDPAGSTAAYLAITGSAFFIAANLTQNTTVSRAQNHLSWHSARRGAIAANLALFAVGGDKENNENAVSAAILVGGIAGDLLGFALAKPMTDAEAHGTSHGSTITAALSGGLLGTAGVLEDSESGSRAGALAIIGAGALGYPLGLRYVRTAPYRVTAGDVGTMVTAEFLGMAAVATLIPEDSWDSSEQLVVGLLTGGFALGAIAADRFLVRPFDHTEAEARLLQYGALAGGLIGVALPVLARADNPNVWFGAATIGGILGAALTTNYMKPASARVGVGSVPSRRVGEAPKSRFDIRVTPEAALLAGMGQRGNHSILSVTF